MTETVAVEKPPAPTGDAAKPAADPKPSARRKPLAWYAQPQIVAAVALIVLIFELVGYAVLGLLGLAIANLAAFAVLFMLVQAWRRKGKGGLLDRLLAKAGRGRNGGRGAANRSRAGGKGARTPGGGGASPAKSGGLRSRIPRAFGGTRGTGGKPASGGTGSSGPRSGAGGESSPRHGSAPAGQSHRTGEGPITPKTPPGKNDPKAAKNDPKAAKPGAEKTPEKPKPPADEKKDEAEEVPKHAKPADIKPPAGTPEHGGTTMTQPKHSDDQSLQRWGANLGGIETSAQEVARLYAEAEAAAELHNQTVAKIRQQGESDLPVSKTLAADVEGLHTRATRAKSADEWRAVANDAATLPTTYHREHETDEDRLRVPRTSLAAEKRADVTTASQDN